MFCYNWNTANTHWHAYTLALSLTKYPLHVISSTYVPSFHTRLLTLFVVISVAVAVAAVFVAVIIIFVMGFYVGESTSIRMNVVDIAFILLLLLFLFFFLLDIQLLWWCWVEFAYRLSRFVDDVLATSLKYFCGDYVKITL